MNALQGVPDTMLQEEVRKLHVALNEERKVTEKLSRNLELEKRRSESLEQKAKSAFRRSGASSSSHAAIFLPEEMRSRDDQIMEKMERFQDQCDRMTQRLSSFKNFYHAKVLQLKIIRYESLCIKVLTIL